MSASGGVYSGENAAFDFQIPWLRNMLGFLGMTDVEVIRIEGTAFGPEAADKALERAQRTRANLSVRWPRPDRTVLRKNGKKLRSARNILRPTRGSTKSRLHLTR